MSRTTTALLVKLIITFAAAWVAFTLVDGNTMGWALWVATLGTIINYVVGDLLVLPSLGNVIASVGDGLMAAIIAYAIDAFSVNFATSFTSLLIFAIIVTVAEFFFHMYLKNDDKVAPNK